MDPYRSRSSVAKRHINVSPEDDYEPKHVATPNSRPIKLSWAQYNESELFGELCCFIGINTKFIYIYMKLGH